MMGEPLRACLGTGSYLGWTMGHNRMRIAMRKGGRVDPPKYSRTSMWCSLCCGYGAATATMEPP
eukprot:594128-Pyramimonas_sp.AAC.1